MLLITAMALAVSASPVLVDDFEGDVSLWQGAPGCEVSNDGHGGGKCLAVTGTGEDQGEWRREASLRPGGLYRMSFRVRSSGAGNCAVSGPETVNRDFSVGAEWTRQSAVCRIPDNAGPTTVVRLGQWHWNGTYWFDDLVVEPVEAVHTGAQGLGEGESVKGREYRFAPVFAWEGLSYARPLAEARARFNTNRWWLDATSSVTYVHELPSARQVSASVAVEIGYYESGEAIVEASSDGVSWTEVGRIGRVGSLRAEMPAALLPADALRVRLRGSEGSSLQVYSYTYTATLDRDLGSITGRTAFLSADQVDPALSVRVVSLDPTGVSLAVTNADRTPLEVVARARLADSDASETRRTLSPGDEATLSVPLVAETAGSLPVSIAVSAGDKLAYTAETTLHVSALALANYGELLEGPAGAGLWWCDATRKVSRERSLPEKRAEDGIRISAARGEYEPFQIVLRPERDVPEGASVEVSDLTGPGGAVLGRDRIAVEVVEYVDVTRPTDQAGAVGEWPDPLPPLEGNAPLRSGVNQPFWVRVHAPYGIPAGDYAGAVRVTAGASRVEVPLTLHVYGFDLPAEPRLVATLGLSPSEIWRYHNITDRATQEAVWDLYMANFAEHRIAPYDPMALWPIRVSFEGNTWSAYVADAGPHGGQDSCAKVIDDSETQCVDVHTLGTYPVDRRQALLVAWDARVDEDGREYQITLMSYDAQGNWLWGRNVDLVRAGSTEWSGGQYVVEAGALPENAVAVNLTFRPAVWSETGERTGAAWFDNVFLGPPGGENLIADGGFSPEGRVPEVDLDFAAWDEAAARYLDGPAHFPAFKLDVMGLGSGTFHSREGGEIGGCVAGTPEYERVMSAYLGGIEAHLREKGWLDKAYVYWFDEPEPKDYDFVRSGMETLHRHAPGASRMLTEQPEEALFGSVDIWCPISDAFRPESARPRMEAGERFWWYVCTGPKTPYPGLFTDHPATDLRVWLWQTFAYDIEGVLVWTTNWWTSSAAFPDSLQDPWTDPMSYVAGYSFGPGQIGYWGNGDGRFVYPPKLAEREKGEPIVTGPINSIRWEMLREGIEDYEYLRTLRDLVAQAREAGVAEAEALDAEALLTVPPTIFASMTEYTIDSTPIYAHRERVAEAIEALARAMDAGN